MRRDSFAASEKEIFLALSRWCRQHVEGAYTQEVMAAVRLPLMTLTEMLNVVRPSGLLSPDDLLDAIKIRSESRNMDLNYRGMLSQCSASLHLLTVILGSLYEIYFFLFGFSPRRKHCHDEVRCSGGERGAQVGAA